MYQTLMVPLDGSELAECVLSHVENLAQGGQARRVILSQVITPLFPHAGYTEIGEKQRKEIEEAHRAAAKEYLQKIAARLMLPPETHLETKVLYGEVAGTLSDFARRSEVDLIVIATHGRSGVGRWVMGSVADRILRSSDAPVLMVRAAGHPSAS